MALTNAIAAAGGAATGGAIGGGSGALNGADISSTLQQYNMAIFLQQAAIAAGNNPNTLTDADIQQIQNAFSNSVNSTANLVEWGPLYAYAYLYNLIYGDTQSSGSASNEMTALPDANKGTTLTTPIVENNGTTVSTPIQDQDKNSGIIADPITNTDQGWNEGYTANPDAGKGTVVTWTADTKIKNQMGGRGWTDADIDSAIAAGPTGTSLDTRWTKTGEKLNDPATVYGTSGNYVVINNKTGDVTQVSDKTDPKWVDDRNIKWNKK